MFVDECSENFCAFPVKSTGNDVEIAFYNLSYTTLLSMHFNQTGNE